MGFSRKKPWTLCWGYQNFQRLPPWISRRKRVTPLDFQPTFSLRPFGFPTFSSYFCLIHTDFHSFIIISDVTPSDKKLTSSTGGLTIFFSGKAQSINYLPRILQTRIKIRLFGHCNWSILWKMLSMLYVIKFERKILFLALFL